jgi:hypothetical protein
MLLPLLAFSQITATVTTKVTEEIKAGKKTTTTTETTTNLMPPFDTTTKSTTTVIDEAKPAPPETTVKDSPLRVISETTVTLTTSKVVPVREISKVNFKNARIYLLKSEVKDNQFQYTYFDRSNNDELTVFVAPIGTHEAITHYQTSALWQLNAPLSIITVPFKIRPDIQNRGQVAKATTNIGISAPIIAGTWNRLFADTGTSKHILSLNVFAAPALETMDASNTNGFVTDAKDNIVLSTGVSVTYTYNDIAFSVIPLGGDFALNSRSKHWVYDKRYWWGFGIGVSPTLLWRVFK